MVNEISKKRKIVGWIIVFIGIFYIFNGIDHLLTDGGSLDDVYRSAVIDVIGFDAYTVYNDFERSVEFNSPLWILMNLDSIPLFIIGVVLIIASRKFIFKIPFRRKK
jgi:hypothetical protein